MPAGSVSVNPTPVTVSGFGLVSVIVSVELPPTGTVDGAKLFATSGCPITSSVAVAAAPLAPFEVVTPPAPMVFVYVPSVAAVTSVVTVQVPPAAIVPPLSCSEVSPAFAVTVPPHEDVAFGDDALTMPNGYLSVNAAFVAGVLPGFVMVTVSVDASPVPIVEGVNVFVADVPVTFTSSVCGVASLHVSAVSPCAI